MNNSSSTIRRRGSLDSSTSSRSQSLGRVRRPSLTSSVRRSSRSIQHDINARLNRSPRHEDTPVTKKERKQRRSRRKSEYKQAQDDRNDRMGAITDQWQSHRNNFVSEEAEMERLMKQNSNAGWCCGMNLCCQW